MDTHFHYNVIPKATASGVTTRVVFQDELTPAEIYAAAGTSTGLTPAQVEAATAAVFRQIITGARAGRRSRRVGGLFSFTPRSGGAFDSPDFEPSAKSLNVGINASLSPEGDALFEDSMTFVREGVLGEKLPEILRIYDATTRTLGAITQGGPFKISGHDFGPEPAPGNTTCGIFLQPTAGGGPPIRIATFSEWGPSEIMGVWPLAVGVPPVLVSVTTCYEGSTDLRTFVWPTPITAT
ncbi:MAG: hypothetical protein K8R23_03305 [Chthoniobacter sp.]|nr:hypothetical protein [Chthoniobacter sp.]